MATKNTTFRNSQADNAASLFNRLDIRTSGGSAVLVTFTVTWNAASGGAIAIASTLSATATGTGTAAEARLYHSTGADEISGITVTVTGGGGQITLVNTSIATDQLVEITSFTFTEPAATA